MDTQAKSTKIWNAVFINAFVSNILLHLGIYMMNTLSAKYADYLIKGLAVTNPAYLETATTLVGMISGLFAATALIFKIVSAPMIDTYNRKHILMGATAILLLSYIGYALSDTIPMLIISRLLTGMGMAFTSTVCLTIASESLPAEKMATGIGYFALGTALSQALAPYVGLKLIEAFSYKVTFLSLAALMVLTIGYTSTMKMQFTRTKQFKISLGSIVAKEALAPALLLFLLSTTFSVINAFLVLYAESMSIENIGIYFTVYAVTMLVSRPLIGKLADKFGPVKVCLPSMVFFAASFIIISFADSLPMLLFAAVISAFGYGGCFPCIQAIAMKSVPNERRGAASCTCYLGTDISNLVGPIISGAIVDASAGASAATAADYVPMWRFMIIPVALAIVMTVVFKNRLNHAGESVKQ